MDTRHRTNCAFTLIETMIASGILLAIGSMALLWLTTNTDLWWTTNTQSELRSNIQLAVNRMVSELRNGTRTPANDPPGATIPVPPGNQSITFYLPADLDGNGLIVDAIGEIEWDAVTPIQYVYDVPTRQVRRVVGVQQRVFANDVTSLIFEDQSIDPSLLSNEVRIRLTMSKVTPLGRTVSNASTVIVQLRN